MRVADVGWSSEKKERVPHFACLPARELGMTIEIVFLHLMLSCLEEGEWQGFFVRNWGGIYAWPF